jgi:hypothetical protein
METWRSQLWSILGVVALAVIVLLLWKGPDALVESVVQGHQDQVTTKEYASLLDDYRKTLAQIIGGIGLGFTLFFTWKTYRLAERDKITGRFARAVELLGSLNKDGHPVWEPRMGGVYALGAIARGSPGDHHTVLQILTAYLRHYAHCQDVREPEGTPVVWKRKEVQAILTVLANRQVKLEKNRPLLDMSNLDLRKADLHSAHLERMNLNHVNLAGANLYMANLDSATFNSSILIDTNMMLADCGRCSFSGADLKGAEFHSADLSQAVITQEQLESAKGNAQTRLPPNMNRPSHWT